LAKVDLQREISRNDELWYLEEREDVGDWFSPPQLGRDGDPVV
jgi:hypothetical protein